MRDQPVGDPKRLWPKMQKVAEIPGVCIHDLRHTFASLLDSAGASLEMIEHLLGHSQIGTTYCYAHLIDAPVRGGVNAAGEMLKARPRMVGDRRDEIRSKRSFRLMSGIGLGHLKRPLGGRDVSCVRSFFTQSHCIM